MAIRGVAFNWMSRAVTFFIAFFVTPIVVTSLGETMYGIWAIIMAAAGYYGLADLGLRAASVKYISEFLATRNADAVNGVVWTSFVCYTVLAQVVMVAASIIAWYFPVLFKGIPSGHLDDIRIAVVLTGLTVAIRLITHVFDAALDALKRFDLTNYISMASSIAQALLIIWVVRHAQSFTNMALVSVAVCVLAQATRLIFAIALMKRDIEFGFCKPNMMSAQLIFGFGFFNVIRNLAGMLASSSGSVIIGMVIGPTQVAFYAIAESLVQKIGMVTRGFNSVLIPVSSELKARKQTSEIMRASFVTARVLLTVSLFISLMFAVAGESFLRLWVGESFAENSHLLLVILSIAFAGRMCSGGLPAILSGAGYVRVVAYIEIIRAAVTLALGIFLLKEFGVAGFAVGMLAASICSHVLAMPIVSSKLLEYPLRAYYLDVFPRAFLTTLCVAPPAWLMFSSIPVDGFADWFVMATAVGILELIAMYYICLDRALRVDIIRSLPFRKTADA